MFSLQNDTFLAVMRGERDSFPLPNLSAVGSTLQALTECLHDVTATILDKWWAEPRSRVAMIRFYDQFATKVDNRIDQHRSDPSVSDWDAKRENVEYHLMKELIKTVPLGLWPLLELDGETSEKNERKKFHRFLKVHRCWHSLYWSMH